MPLFTAPAIPPLGDVKPIHKHHLPFCLHTFYSTLFSFPQKDIHNILHSNTCYSQPDNLYHTEQEPCQSISNINSRQQCRNHARLWLSSTGPSPATPQVTWPTIVCSSQTPVSDNCVLPTLLVSQMHSSFGDANLTLCGLSYGQFRQLLKKFLFRQWGHSTVWTVFLTVPNRNILTYLTSTVIMLHWIKHTITLNDFDNSQTSTRLLKQNGRPHSAVRRQNSWRESQETSVEPSEALDDCYPSRADRTGHSTLESPTDSRQSSHLFTFTTRSLLLPTVLSL